jgi:hypothetical protein
MMIHEKSLKNEASKASKKKDKLANKVHRPQTAEQKPAWCSSITARSKAVGGNDRNQYQWCATKGV